MSLRVVVPITTALVALVTACTGGAGTPLVVPTNDGTGTSNGSSGRDADGGSDDSAIGAGDAGGGAICSLPKVSGQCEAYFPSYWFNAATGKCEAFVYGGCEGNANRFETPEACVAACAPDDEVDPCKAVVCAEGKKCLYQGATPVCAEPCEDGTVTCSGDGLTCKCAGSCPNCKDCRKACLP